MTEPGKENRLPLPLKLFVTAWVAVVLPVYWSYNGPAHFLWFSQIALMGTCVGLWLESALLFSMMAVGVLLPELGWNLEILVFLLTGFRGTGATSYMFDPILPVHDRLLSLFHVWLPPLLLFLLLRLGYDRRALLAQTLLAWVVLPLAWWLGGSEANINWTHGFGPDRHTPLGPAGHLAAIMIGFPLLLFLPTHLLLRWGFPAAPGPTERTGRP